MDNYTEINAAVRCKKELKGNSCQGYHDSANGYIIKSYNTIIYSDTQGLNTEYYSTTTSKLQTIILRHLLPGNETLKQLREVKAMNVLDKIIYRSKMNK